MTPLGAELVAQLAEHIGEAGAAVQQQCHITGPGTHRADRAAGNRSLERRAVGIGTHGSNLTGRPATPPTAVARTETPSQIAPRPVLSEHQERGFVAPDGAACTSLTRRRCVSARASDGLRRTYECAIASAITAPNCADVSRDGVS